MAIDGQCTYATPALAELLQCGVEELYGTGWRVRISPFADRPFDPNKAIEFARSRTPIRLASPDGRTEIVSRIRVLTDPRNPSRVTGFLGRVQVIRVHRQLKITSPARAVASSSKSA